MVVIYANSHAVRSIFLGILWPVEGMPWYLQKIAWYLPCTASCQAMRDIMARGWDISK